MVDVDHLLGSNQRLFERDTASFGVWLIHLILVFLLTVCKQLSAWLLKQRRLTIESQSIDAALRETELENACAHDYIIYWFFLLPSSELQVAAPFVQRERERLLLCKLAIVTVSSRVSSVKLPSVAAFF